MDYITSAPAIHPVTQVSYTAVTVITDKRINTAVIFIIYVNNDIKETNRIFSSAGPHPHDEEPFVHLFFSLVASQT
jgi:hypothetical protein